MRKGFVLFILLLITIVGRPVAAQQVTTTQEVPKFKILSARFVTEAKGLFESSWSIQNSQRTGIVVAVEASFSGESLPVTPQAYFIEYSLGGGSRFTEECVGLASSEEPKPGDWVFEGPGQHAFLSLNRGGEGKSTFALLFAVSKKISEYSLIYRHPAAVVKGVAPK
jgi:hypothetical protein